MKRMIDDELIESLTKGELKAIAHYQFANGKLTDYGKFEGNTDISILGLEDNKGNFECIGLGYFTISNQEVENFVIVGYDFYNDDIMRFSLSNDKTIDNSMYAKSEDIPFLYRHVITLHANSTADGSCRLEWISSNNLVCDSLQDLRTVLGNPQMQSYIASNPSGDLFGVVISPSTAQIKKVGTTSLLNITSVSDTVTAL